MKHAPDWVKGKCRVLDANEKIQKGDFVRFYDEKIVYEVDGSVTEIGQHACHYPKRVFYRKKETKS